ncbi:MULTISPECIES: hypothetical protein [Arenibacter]|uniref:hypothetical protein n=1 Tax=Arenibacter TaxID=178469 RepID=UPI000A3C88BA|nr:MULTISPECIES: hypothetical protein [Arenibacter]
MKKNQFLIFLAFFLLLVFITLVTVSRRQIIREYNKVVKESLFLNDSINALMARNMYIDELNRVHQSADGFSIKNNKFYKLQEDGAKKQITIPFSNKKLVLIRYSRAGCDKCIEQLFRNQDLLNQIKSKHDLAIIVDFEEYDDFKKWQRSTIAPGEQFIWVDDTTPLNLDKYMKNETSYIFVVDEIKTVHSIFIPNISFQADFYDYINLLSVDN